MSGFPVPIRKIVTLLAESAYTEEWLPALDSADLTVIDFDLAETVDERGFFARATAALGGSAPMRTWSGVEDYLWQRLSDSPTDEVLITFRHVDRAAANALSVLLDAVSLVEDLIRRTGPDATSFPRELELRLVLTGSGPSFPPA